MNKTDLEKYYKRIKAQGITAEQDKKMLAELNDGSARHGVPVAVDGQVPDFVKSGDIYSYHDLSTLQDIPNLIINAFAMVRSLDELMEQDRQREKDGFPRKIRIGRLVKPDRRGRENIVVVPSTVEEKFIHDNKFDPSKEESSGGSGEGEEGDVIGEQPLHEEGEGSGAGPGEGGETKHEIASSAYDLGKILTEQFELPNLKDKGKKRSLTKYTYDMTDIHRGVGQLLDKKATIRKIVETNISLGNIPDVYNIDPSRFLVAPTDKVYRILSKEKDYESQAMVFFLRDYSGSMSGKCTELIVTQHVLIYSWLLYQYDRQVETRFVLHDTDAKEVEDFYTYYNSKVAGGTRVASAFRLVNEIVENESLEKDYNIYVFHGTDGDDWDTEGKETLPEINKMLKYVSRIGVSIAEHASGIRSNTEVERYLEKSNLLKEQPSLIRLDVMGEDADEQRLIEGIKTLISE